jgi:hypothetical protein
VVVRDLDLVRVAVSPDEADPKLVIDSNAMLPQAVSLESFQSIAGERQISQALGLAQLVQLAPGGPLDGLKTLRELIVEDALSFRVAERPDHRL